MPSRSTSEPSGRGLHSLGRRLSPGGDGVRGQLARRGMSPSAYTSSPVFAPEAPPVPPQSVDLDVERTIGARTDNRGVPASCPEPFDASQRQEAHETCCTTIPEGDQGAAHLGSLRAYGRISTVRVQCGLKRRWRGPSGVTAGWGGARRGARALDNQLYPGRAFLMRVFSRTCRSTPAAVPATCTSRRTSASLIGARRAPSTPAGFLGSSLALPARAGRHRCREHRTHERPQ